MGSKAFGSDRRRKFRGLRAILLGLLMAAAPARAQTCDDIAPGDFAKVTLVSGLASPLKMALSPDGRIFVIHRNGIVQMLRPGTTAPVPILKLPVPAGANNEDGLLGIALDPGFTGNRRLFLYYTPPSPMGYRLSRFTLNGDVLEDERVLLAIPHAYGAYGPLIIHGAGALAFAPDGNLLLSTGDLCITNGGHPVPVNEGLAHFDAQATSANTNHLLGKILRIAPKEDGSYGIPPGNLFPPGTALTRPEIYAMGLRNPFTMTVDPATGWIYSGEVGPDGVGGPIASQDEINQLKAPGNLGWPYLTGDDQPYADLAGNRYDPGRLMNGSRNNTGLRTLPPPVKSLFWMSNLASWPVGGILPKQGNRCIKVGAFYRFDARGSDPRRLPRAFDNGFFMANHNDGETLKFVKLDASGGITSVKALLGNLARPIAMEAGPDGVLHLLEWGTDNGHWFNAGNGVLSRLEYRGGCHAAAAAPGSPATPISVPRLRVSVPGLPFLLPKGVAGAEVHDLRGVRRGSLRAAGAPTGRHPSGLLILRPHPG